ncbi:unnamed protein product [Cuscuta epithymum]|uniref:Uncharacterized protein n=1 Tax=Cuscuta epithymum TaxID=186058 RepID=A0AAV0C6D4_9ASTE|nr:unnamed protein product [Cuscuta epithymum]
MKLKLQFMAFSSYGTNHWKSLVLESYDPLHYNNGKATPLGKTKNDRFLEFFFLKLPLNMKNLSKNLSIWKVKTMAQSSREVIDREGQNYGAAIELKASCHRSGRAVLWRIT